MSGTAKYLDYRRFGPEGFCAIPNVHSLMARSLAASTCEVKVHWISYVFGAIADKTHLFPFTASARPFLYSFSFF